MQPIYQTWGEIRGLFAKRGLPAEYYGSLYEEEYILHPGPAKLGETLREDDHDFRKAHPWYRAGGRPQYEGLDGAVTGYVVDGSLEIDGNLINGDMGSPALIVLGDLRAKNVYISGDLKLIVQGNVEVDAFVGSFGDKLLIIQGDLTTRVAVFSSEFAPDAIGGVLRGHVLPKGSYEDPIEDPTPDADVAALFVPEVMASKDKPPKGEYGALGLDPMQVFERIEKGLPILRGA